VLASVVAVGLRFRRSAGEERQQLKWLVYAGVLTFFVLITSSPAVPLDLPEAVAILALLCLPSIPVAVGIAILRNRLYDIDLVINRTLVYGALTACVVGIYVVVVGYLGALFSTGGNVVISLAATGVVAVLFQPLRERLQRAVNRLMYGERDEPYAVLTRLGERLEATVEPRAVLPAVVETVAQALKVPHAAIELRREGGYETAAEYGMPSGEPLVLALTYQNEAVGRLVLSPRTKGETFTKSDLRLLEDLARQVGVAAHAVRLTADLQRSRERLVTAREEERRRLRRDLHDGVGPQLAALTLKIETARNRLAHDPDADVLLSDLAKRARDAVADVRRAVHALRPPTLDELGLVPALRETAAQYEADGLSVSVESPEEISALPAAVEVAAYRIAQEAMTNAVRHAGASRCQVRFDLDEGAGLLRLEISDDGRGIGEDRGVGVGLSSMRERAEELGGTCVVEPVPGGGTRVRAELPWRIEREPDA
jgi:signal transduction histidine kinase